MWKNNAAPYITFSPHFLSLSHYRLAFDPTVITSPPLLSLARQSNHHHRSSSPYGQFWWDIKGFAFIMFLNKEKNWMR